MDKPLRELDARIAEKEKRIDAAKKRKRRESYARKRAGMTDDMRGRLFGHLGSSGSG
jgi:hypothetical protein